MSGPLAVVAWSTATALIYLGARALYARVGLPLLHPLLVSMVMLGLGLDAVGRGYGEYRESTAWLTWWIGPAVVAMAVPVWQLRRLILQRLALVVGVVVAGLLFGFVVAAGALRWQGQPREVQLAGPLQSTTSPVALPLGERSGARLDAVIVGVLASGLVGATMGPLVLRSLGVRDRRARGLAMGCGSHVIGVSRSLEVDPICGAFATLGMMGNAILGSVLYPWLAAWW
ncbi:MAG: LrgB family protein [Verrucomicrobia bacterium]|nr:LrgB family protein [Verrucomicrobiota bacterium]